MPEWRDGIRKKYDAGPGKFPCPHKFRRTLHFMKLGTLIAKATHKAGIRQCGGCKKRQKILDGEVT